MSLRIRRLSYPLGAEIIGLDLRKPIDDKTYSEIHNAFLEHDGVLLFREQPLTSEQHIEFSRCFGELEYNDDEPPQYRHPQYREVALVYNPTAKGKISERYKGEQWHTDFSFTCSPPNASLLRSLQIPQVGGDTMFANMYLAYQTLSDGMKKLIDGLEGIHVNTGNRIDRSTPERLAETTRLNSAVQPLARVHPETKRKALYLAPYPKVTQFVEMTEEESKPLIQFLIEHATRPQFCYRHVWQKDDLLVWDNRCLLHRGIGDFDRNQTRDMERTTIKGEQTGRRP